MTLHDTVRGNRRGSALITVMLLVIFMVIAIAGVFLRTSAERRHSMDGAAQLDAFALAADGIDKYLGAVTAIPASLPDSQVFTLTGGRAVVTMMALRQASGDTTLAVVSRGENTSGSVYSPLAGTATRTLTQLVKWTGGTMDLDAGFVSLSGMDKNGNSGGISGVDACNTAPAPLASIPGAAVPSVSAGDTSANYTGKRGPIAGSMGSVPENIGTPGYGGTAAASVDLDWAGISARTAITPKYYMTSAQVGSKWPTTAQITGSNWPVVFVSGDLSLPSSGQGILIVTGNFSTSGNKEWDGILLVGGVLSVSGTPNFYGAVISGLNVKLDSTVAQSSVGSGNVTIQYNSCNIAKALQPFGSWLRLGNAKTDNFPIY